MDLRGDTALHEAAGGGHEPVTGTLLAGRANPNAVGYSGETPLIRAARRGHKGVVEVCSPALQCKPAQHKSADVHWFICDCICSCPSLANAAIAHMLQERLKGAQDGFALPHQCEQMHVSAGM